MDSRVRGVGSDLGGALLVVLGAAGFVLPPAAVARLLTVVVVALGVRDLVVPGAGRSPRLLVLMVGLWLAICAYGFWGFDFLSGWPLLVVLVGVAMVVEGIADAGRDAPADLPADAPERA